MNHRNSRLAAVGLIVIGLLGSLTLDSFAQDSLPLNAIVATPSGSMVAETLNSESDQDDIQAAYDQCVSEGLKYLSSIQTDVGDFDTVAGPGVVALITSAMLRNGVPADEPVVAKALKYLEEIADPETGGIHGPDSLYKNYETCLAILCFSEANESGRYDEMLAKADTFIKTIQWGGAEFSTDESDFAFGGAGYGKHRRPDLSNTSYMVDALVATGNDEDSEAIQRALTFISRSQNFESSENSAPFAAKNPDGGFYYTPAAGGQSQAGEAENGGLRSYGSMTYAGLKSMIYAGVSKDDPRVKAAIKWLKRNYRLNENPNMGAAGLFYYYHTFAKALEATGEDSFEDADGVGHDWRRELILELAERQRDDGSWVNSENPRWLEDNAALVTGYALLALSHSKPK